jgi:hypothetical protein
MNPKGEAMGQPDQKILIVDVTLPNRQPAQPILDGLLKGGLTAATVVRGRVTTSEAWFRLELKGSVRALDAALRGRRANGFRLSPIPA